MSTKELLFAEVKRARDEFIKKHNKKHLHILPAELTAEVGVYNDVLDIIRGLPDSKD